MPVPELSVDSQLCDFQISRYSNIHAIFPFPTVKRVFVDSKADLLSDTKMYFVARHLAQLRIDQATIPGFVALEISSNKINPAGGGTGLHRLRSKTSIACPFDILFDQPSACPILTVHAILYLCAICLRCSKAEMFHCYIDPALGHASKVSNGLLRYLEHLSAIRCYDLRQFPKPNRVEPYR